MTVLRNVDLASTIPYYRTNNFAGLPKGSYCNPNPKHFHIVHTTSIAPRLRPSLIKICPPSRVSHYIFNRFNGNYGKDRQTVTISVGGLSTVSHSMSLQAIRDFITPFHSALNMIENKKINNSQKDESSQTTYFANRLENGDLIKDMESVTYKTDYENLVLQKMHASLVADLTKSDSERSLGEFSDEECFGLNESLANVSSNNTPTYSLDEGIGDLTQLSSTNHVEEEIDIRVIKLGNIIFNYMAEQGFEESDLIIFPEILDDTNTNKLINQLLDIYEQLYPEDLSNEERNILRLQIGSYVLQRTESDKRLKSSNESLNSSLVSDKVFTISETLCTILDHFFDSLESTLEDRLFASPVPDFNENKILHSTPEVVEEITAFKKDVLHKPGHEMYWFSVSSPREQKSEPKVLKTIINPDDIPLPLPREVFTTPKTMLAPILEELTQSSRFDEMAGGDSNLLDNVLSGDESFSYVSFEKPETNVVLSTDVNFSRTITTTSSAYVNIKTMILNRTHSGGEGDSFYSVASHLSGDEIDNQDSDEGDWMGYEQAKF